MSGEIHFHITEQQSKGGTIFGKIEITGWNVDPNQVPEDWPGDWTGEDNEVELTGWLDEYTRYLKARYFYYVGYEGSADYRANEDIDNLKGLYIWIFDSLNITDTGISGQFTITGDNEYYEIGVFNSAKYVP